MAEKNIFLKGGTLIDGNGGDVVKNSGVLIRGEKIEKVGNADMAVPSDTDIQDVSGKIIMPGLIDAHVHLSGNRSSDPIFPTFEPEPVQMGRILNDLPKLIDAGFTGVRDLGSAYGVHLKTLMEEGEYKGPRIKTANSLLSQTGGHGDKHMLPPEFSEGVCDGVADCRKTARNQFRQGADLIKIASTGGVLSEKDDPKASQFSMDEIKAIVEVADATESFVAAHAEGTYGINNAIKGGARTIEHGIYIDNEGIEMMLKKSLILVPTLSIVKRIVEEGEEFGIPEYSMEKARRVHEDHGKNIKRAYEAGITIALGTDFSSSRLTPLGENAQELDLLVNDVGMSPMEAIVAATKHSAQAKGTLDTVGTIEKEKMADILVVEGNPLEYINILLEPKYIEKVFVGGELLKGD